MTIGISKERLEEIVETTYLINKLTGDYLRAVVDLNCAELEPWLPIDSAPLNKLIRVFSPYTEHYGQTDVILAVEDNRRYFTKWKELPEDPKE